MNIFELVTVIVVIVVGYFCGKFFGLRYGIAGWIGGFVLGSAVVILAYCALRRLIGFTGKKANAPHPPEPDNKN